MAMRAISAHSDSVGMPVASPAAGATGVGALLPVLLPGLLSSTSEETVAVLVTVPLVAVTSACSAIVALAPLASVPRLQLNGSVPVQEPCDGVALMNCSPAGRSSLTITFVAGSGPLFVTVIV